MMIGLTNNSIPSKGVMPLEYPPPRLLAMDRDRRMVLHPAANRAKRAAPIPSTVMSRVIWTIPKSKAACRHMDSKA